MLSLFTFFVYFYWVCLHFCLQVNQILEILIQEPRLDNLNILLTMDPHVIDIFSKCICAEGSYFLIKKFYFDTKMQYLEKMNKIMLPCVQDFLKYWIHFILLLKNFFRLKYKQKIIVVVWQSFTRVCFKWRRWIHL